MKTLSELFDENENGSSFKHTGFKTMSKEIFLKVVNERIRQELVEYDKWINRFVTESDDYFTMECEDAVDQYLSQRAENRNETEPKIGSEPKDEVSAEDVLNNESPDHVDESGEYWRGDAVLRIMKRYHNLKSKP